MTGLEALRTLRGIAELAGDFFLRPHLPPTYLVFDERWDMAEQEMTPEGQLGFFCDEIRRLRRRIIKGGVEHRTIDQGRTTLYLDLKREDIKKSTLPAEVKNILVPSEGQELAASMVLETGGKIALRVGRVPPRLVVGDWVDLVAESKVDTVAQTGKVVSWAQGPVGHRLEGFIARVGDFGVARELVRLADFVIDGRVNQL